MKSLYDVKKELELLRGSNFASLKKMQAIKIRNRIQLLTFIESYLKESPTEEFIKSEVERIEKRINAIMAIFDPTLYKNPKPAMKKHEKDNGVPHLREQLRTLWYILN